MHDRVPGYYVENGLYPDSYVRTEWQTRTSRRMHGGLAIDKNFGLDTTTDDVDSSIYSSPFYINGRYYSDNSSTQSGNSASVQGITRLLSYGDREEDFTNEDCQTTIEMWQGKRIRFSIPYNGKVVGNTLTLRNTGGCTGILSIYFSLTEGGKPVYETAVDLCNISMDVFEHIKLYSALTIASHANPRGKLYVNMEIWDEISIERSDNPFNTGRKIEIAATGLSNHEEAVVKLGSKNLPVTENWEYNPRPNRPCVGLIYNDLVSVPTNRTEANASGATVSLNGYKYDIYCYKSETEAKVLIYDKVMNSFIDNDIKVDARVSNLNLVQAEDYVYYVDGYSTLQKFRIGEWISRAFDASTADNVVVNIDINTWIGSGVAEDSGLFLFSYHNNKWYYNATEVQLATYGITITGSYTDGGRITVTYQKAGEDVEADVSGKYEDARPVIAPSLITLHNNRIYLAGFRYDPNLIQFTEIVSAGPDFDSYIYRFYAPDESPLATSDNPLTAITPYQTDTLMLSGRRFHTMFTTNSGRSSGNPENSYPVQVASYVDSGGVASAGDICNYQGRVYSFDPDEGLRRFNGATWEKIPAAVDTYYERVDMDKPRKLWGYANKLYYNYIDKIDHKYKCLIWDKEMNYQQYPFFQDSDMPFCDVRWDDDYNIVGIHPDYPCIMKLYDENVWKRFDTPITFERWTKAISMPDNISDMILKDVFIKTIANANRWWLVGLSFDRHNLTQNRLKTVSYRIPVWDTLKEETNFEDLFTEEDIYNSKSISLSAIGPLKVQCISTQVKIKCKTYRQQASLVSIMLEAQPRQMN